MALDATNIRSGNKVTAADVKQYYNIFTGVTTDQPINMGKTTYNGVGCRASRTANQTINSGAQTIVRYTASDLFNTDTMRSGGTGKIQIKTAGKYLVLSSIAWAADGTATGVRTLQINLIDTTAIAESTVPAPTIAFTQQCMCLRDFVVGDYLQSYAYQTSGGGLDIVGSGNANIWMAAVKVG